MNKNNGGNFFVIMASILITFGVFTDITTHGIVSTLGIGLMWICMFLNNIASAIREGNEKKENKQ